MRCNSCEAELSPPPEAFTGDVCPACHHFAHPTRLGLYEHLELIKRGGMGAVYRARHPRLGTTVAIKAVHTHTGPATLAERFEREAGLAARIPHPGVVRVFDYDCQEGRLYLVMEHVDGTTLRQQIQDGRRELAWCIDKIVQLCDILQAAHDQGIVHRDIKPENVMIDSTGKVRVLDFGISLALTDGDRLTQPGEILGTPEYIAPEQILDEAAAVDARTDIYATGVVLYEMLTGISPFAGTNLFQVLKYVEARIPPRPGELVADLPVALDAVVMEAIAKDKAQRPTSAAQLARRLREIARAGQGPAGRRTGWPPLAWASVILCVVLGTWAVAAEWRGAAVRAPDTGRVDAAPLDPLSRLRLLLDGSHLDRAELRALAAQIPDDAAPAAIHARARAHQATGSLFLAWRDFERVRSLTPEATRQARVAWIHVHRLVPALFGTPRWLMTGIAPPADDAADDGIAALMRNEFGAAAARLTEARVPGADGATLLALAHHLAGDPVAAAAAAARAGDAEHLPLRLLAAVLDPSGAPAALRVVVADLDRLAPVRYFVEAAIAMRQGDLRRLSAATELALVAGESEFATAIYLAGRLLLSERSERAAQCQALRPIADELSPSMAPGLACTRILLAHGAGDDPAVGRLLDELSVGDDDPCLAWFRAWRALRAADPASSEMLYQALDAAWFGTRDLGVPRLQAWLQTTPASGGDGVDLARRYIAMAALAPTERSQTDAAGLHAALLAAAQHGADLEGFRRQVESAPYRPVRPDLLLATLRRGVEAGLPAAVATTLLRLLRAWGGDLRALQRDARLQRILPSITALLPGGKDG